MLIIGLMSGTSADGVDAALVDIGGESRAETARCLAVAYHPYADRLRSAVLEQCARTSSDVSTLCILATALAIQYAAAAATVAERAGISLADVTAIACHGQTVWHQPDPVADLGGAHRGTMQIGSAPFLAAATGCAVVSDFRTADMAAGGQGAPLVPYADWVLLGTTGAPRAVQNIGGIANVTYLPASGNLSEVLAFDTGPGNMVIDCVAGILSNGAVRYDEAGMWSAQGRPDYDIVERLIADERFFAAPPPKSTGRELFGREFVEHRFLPVCERHGLFHADTMATATALTAVSIELAYRRWLYPLGRPETVIVGGGGVHNRTLMRMLSDRLAPSRISTHEAFGIPDDFKEAVAFAILAYETLHGRPSNVPAATGAAYPCILGSVTMPPNGGGRVRWEAVPHE